MNVIKYISSYLLLFWGLWITLVKLFLVGFHIPFLTTLTIIALIIGVSAYKQRNIFFLISASSWIVFSSETIGFVIFFDISNYEWMIMGMIPLLLGSILLMFSRIDIRLINSPIKKLFLLASLISLGIGSYIYKPRLEEVNCWYYFEEKETYNVLFAETPERKFEVELSSYQLKDQVKAQALQYKEVNGYYCPETKVQVITSFSKIISAKILSFRNSDVDKNVDFTNSTSIPLYRVKGNVEILKPDTLILWN